MNENRWNASKRGYSGLGQTKLQLCNSTNDTWVDIASIKVV
ncbi:hypothetical protein SynPROSU1_01284 [Synechococcus sp. PROS-U-1]|nr:hypothetical protein SynPROSU1_01284 [Synechococcus sp. PROS-U-1]